MTTVTHTPLAEAEHSQVLIAGGGPAGMVLAYRLAKQGITVRVLEAATHCMEDMRASTFHPPTLGMMDALGLLPALEAQGLKAPVFQYSNRATGSNFALDAGEIADVTPYPYRLQCEQFKLTRLIAGLLAEMPNATVEFSRRIIHFEQDADGVTAHGEGPIDIKPYRADYLVAADGASSTVRKWLGVQFDGFTYAESFLTLSTAYPIERHLPWLADVNYVADPPEWCVLLRVPGLWRVLVPQTATTADEDIRSDARKDAVFAHLLGPDAPIVETHHRTVYRVHQRVAQTFRVGRVALIGDSAHLNNPLGGFGMNSGVHDAWNLADKLERVLLGGEDAAPLLDLYDRQRRGVTHGFVQKQTIANKGALGSAFADREAQLSALMKDTDARRAYLMNQLMLNTPALEAAIT